ncbi:CPBP family intramembrane metalloprotease [Halorarum halophilum]|uniref:CPBP family intramembrane metalloprotease n=1 Tax=Halorarum halophilum TaxID=2743090 RepID=A0A7D5L2U9_9EURY|nr:type II CAAX endopeptidase family protein [Halobaculum halophilum]QLG28303.1 CPBP family intramembrane metalloprotease [Halobaculum halophilum]
MTGAPDSPGPSDRPDRSARFPRLRRFVWIADERRPTAPLRLLAALIVVGILAVGTSFLLLVLPLSGVAFTVVAGLAVPVAVTLAVLLVARFVDRRRLSDLGLRRERGWLADLGFGLVLGVGLQALVAVVGLAAGWYRLAGVLVGPPIGLLTTLALFVGVGVYEELLIRGYLLTNLGEWFGRHAGSIRAAALALLASSGVFGAAHLANPGSTAVSTLGITFAGVFLGLGYLLTGRLSLPIGVHISWNYAQGSVFGFPVSGLNVESSLLALEPTGPRVVTGGSFGPEAGLLGTLALCVGIAATVLWVRWRGGRGLDGRVLTLDRR